MNERSSIEVPLFQESEEGLASFGMVEKAEDAAGQDKNTGKKY